MENNRPQAANYQPEYTAINAKEFLWKYAQFSWLFILTLLLALTSAWLYLRYTKHVYSVSSTMLIRNDNHNRSGGAMSSQDMFSDIGLFQSNTNKQNEILILSSRSMMERVVQALGIEKEYMVLGNVKTTNAFPEQPFDLQVLTNVDSLKQFTLAVHFSKDWSSFTIDEDPKKYTPGTPFDLPYGKFNVALKQSVYRQLEFREFTVSVMPLSQAALHYGLNLEVKPANDLSNVLSLTYIHENTSLATAIINELMNQYTTAAIEDKNEMNKKIVSFINDRLRIVEGQLDSVEGNLERYRTNRQVIDLSSQSEMYFGDMTGLTEKLRQQEIQLQVVGLLEQYLNNPENRLSLVPSTLGITDPTLLQLTSAYNSLVVERLKEIQTGATANNPIIRNLEANIEEARVKMIQNLSNIRSVYTGTVNALNSQLASLRKEITTIPERERGTREKARQQEIKQNLYLYLMQKREESEIAQASTISNSRIIDRAVPLFTLVNPIPIKVYGISVLIGLVLPILIIYIRDLLNDKVTTRADISKITSAPVLGEIGHSEDEKVLLFPNNGRGLVAEQMRILRSNLRFILGEKFDTPTILVTSSFSGEGKSFISTNLGAALAISGKKTVILEFDLRKPKILEGLGLSKGNGLTNFLVGNADIRQLPQPVPQVNDLYVISCGQVPPNPSEILLTSKVPELFAWLREHFDAIVIDTAPVGLVSDAFTLSQYSDSTIYVIRQRYTYKRQLNFIDELYSQKKLPHMGILVNDVLIKGASGYYGYGGSYGYGYGYGEENGYYQVDQRKSRKRLKKMFR